MSLVDFYKGKKILITGHTGFKGSWLAKILVDYGAEVIGLALEPDTDPNMFSLLNLPIKSYIHDIYDFYFVQDLIKTEKPEIVIHMAAQPLVRRSYDDPLYTFKTNVMGTVNVLEAIRLGDRVKAVVVVTTDKVYENKEQEAPYAEDDELGGHDPYSTSKAGAELVARSYIRSFFSDGRVKVATARAGNVIGGGDWSIDRLIPDIVKTFMKGETLAIRSPDAIRPWQHVLEPLRGYLMIAKMLYEGNDDVVGAFNFAPLQKDSVKVNEIVEKAKKILGKGDYKVVEDKTKHETSMLRLDATKAGNVLGWKPRLDIDKALDMTFSWYSSYYNKNDIVKVTAEQIKEYFKDD